MARIQYFNTLFNNVCWVIVFLIPSNQQSLKAQTLFPKENPVVPFTVPQDPKPPDLLSPSKPSYPRRTPTFPQSDQYPATAKITKFVFEGNEVFSDRQLEVVVAPYTGREI